MKRYAGALLALACAACGSDAGASERRAGSALALALDDSVTLLGQVHAPHRCARMPVTPPALPDSLDDQYVDDQLVLNVEGKVHIGVVADARAAVATSRLKSLASEFEKRGADLVVSLGGMGTTSEEITAALAPFAEKNLKLLAMPGDREGVPGHRAAVRRLQQAGHEVVDGSQVRRVKAGSIALVTLPGLADQEHLVAGENGCLFNEADLGALAELKATVWLSYAPPRQDGPGGSDLGQTRIHVGSPALGKVLYQSGPSLAVHGMVGQPPAGGKATLKAGTPLILASGALEDVGTEAAPAALFLTLDGARLRYQRIEAPR
jgi:hypothetical protein